MILNITKEDDEAMVSRLNFESDLNSVGLNGEGLAKQYVEQLGYTFISGPPEGQLKVYDLLCSYGEHLRTFECKADILCKPPYKEYDPETGQMEIKTPDTFNIFIEFTSWQRDSGIVTTKSDIWLYNFYHLREIWTIPTPRLKKLINENTFPIGVGGDPGSDSKGYLIKKNKFIEYFNKTDYQLNII